MLPATGRPAPKALPTVLSEPNRQQLWKAALAMIAARPLLGIGPDGFRLNYGHFATPRLAAWDQRILANSLYLELGADLGLIGAALFLAFILSLVRPLLASVRTPRRLDLRQIALLAAFAAVIGHGLVDYNLESHAIFILTFVLCGIAAAYAPVDRRSRSGGL
jgi:O-antigen ligase